MTARVWKFRLPNMDNLVEMPCGARVLSIAEQFGRPALWALVDPDAPLEAKRFVCCMTGEPVDHHAARFVGTALMDGGAFVLHVFEVRP